MALSAVKNQLTVETLARGAVGGTAAKSILLNADTLNFALSTGASAAPAVTDATPFATATQVANGNGYTTNGVTLTGATSNSSGTEKLYATAALASPTWTASGAGFNFRYIILYDSTTTSSITNILLDWDYGSSQALSGANGDSFDISQAAAFPLVALPYATFA